MCQLCRHQPPGATSALQEVFHELELEDIPNAPRRDQIPEHRLPWRERRERRFQQHRGGTNRSSLLSEVLQNL